MTDDYGMDAMGHNLFLSGLCSLFFIRIELSRLRA